MLKTLILPYIFYKNSKDSNNNLVFVSIVKFGLSKDSKQMSSLINEKNSNFFYF